MTEETSKITDIIKINPKKPEKTKIKRAAKVIREGGLVAFPTETVYGLGANALDEKAVKEIFKAKGRPNDNPLIVHISDKKDVYKLARDVPKSAEKLMKKFWPGPLTLILKKKEIIPDTISAGLDTVAVRMPKNKIAIELIRESGVPIAAPSANISGKPSPTTAEHVVNDLMGKIDIIIDGGMADIGLESTVIDITRKPAIILRPGKITRENIIGVIGNTRYDDIIKKENIKNITPRAPGMKYKHYSPKGKIIIIGGDQQKSIIKAKEILHKYKDEGKKVCIIKTSKAKYKEAHMVRQLKEDNEMIAREMFNIFRECDKKNIDIIIIGSVKEKGLGVAIMNRMRKAATEIIKID